MPTATEFDQAARTLWGAADELTALVLPAEGLVAETVSVGGRLTRSIETLVADDDADAKAAARDAEALARECELRAEVCRSYEAELASYASRRNRYENERRSWEQRVAAHERGDLTGRPGPAPRPPRRPDPPPPWVENETTRPMSHLRRRAN